MGRRYQDILETVGNTPVVRINRLGPAGVNLFVKVEAFNPLGSVKDRLALGVIEAAEKSGELKPGQTVIEATSGNTGIGLAMVCAAKGYPLVVTMAETFSIERRRLMRFLGVKVVVTPAAERASDDQQDDRACQDAWLVHDQAIRERGQSRLPFAHDGARNHRRFCRRETGLLGDGLWDWRNAEGCCAGACQGAPGNQDRRLRAGGRAAAQQRHRTERNPDGTPAAAHPTFKPHPMQGWTPDFIPKITGDAVAMNVIDRVLSISGPEAIRCSKELATRRASLSASRQARRWPARSRSRRKPRRVPISSACFPTPASVI